MHISANGGGFETGTAFSGLTLLKVVTPFSNSLRYHVDVREHNTTEYKLVQSEL